MDNISRVDRDLELRVIHALRLTGFSNTGDVATGAGREPEETAELLRSLQEAGFVRYVESRLTGWTLTPAGRARGECLLSAALDGAGKRSIIETIYRDFLELNQPFLGLCTRWQTKLVDGAQLVNDHRDDAYDARVVSDLGATHVAIFSVCERLADEFDRFGVYAPRFAHALERVLSGELEWFTKATIDSYHSIWFQLHEDLLATLGIERAKEGYV